MGTDNKAIRDLNHAMSDKKAPVHVLNPEQQRQEAKVQPISSQKGDGHPPGKQRS